MNYKLSYEVMIYEEIRNERLRQDKQWGGPSHDDRHTRLTWVWLICKHASKAIVDDPKRDESGAWRANPVLSTFRAQMIRVAALAVAAIESLDRAQTTRGDTASPPEPAKVAPRPGGDVTHKPRLCPLCGLHQTRDAYCDACAIKAAEHREGDIKCGRRWQCACAVCRGVRLVIGSGRVGDMAPPEPAKARPGRETKP